MVDLIIGVVQVQGATRHARREVAPPAAQDDDDATGHVLTGVVAGSLDDDRGARVAHRTTLADDATDEDLTARGAVTDHVARNDVLVTAEGGRGRGRDDDASARETLARVVIRVTPEAQRQTLGNERSQTLSRRTFEVDRDVVVLQRRRAQRAGDGAAGQ